MKFSVPKIVAIVVLALATWSLSYIVFAERLTDAETSVVVAGWTIVVFTGDWMWSRLRDRKDANAPPS